MYLVDMQPLLLFSSSPPVSHQQHQPLWPENLLYIVVTDHFIICRLLI